MHSILLNSEIILNAIMNHEVHNIFHYYTYLIYISYIYFMSKLNIPIQIFKTKHIATALHIHTIYQNSPVRH